MSWQAIKRTNLIDWDTLCDFLELDAQKRKKVLQRSHFPLNLPLRLARKIKKNTLEDPLLLQFVPLDKEQISVSGFRADPVEEACCFKAPKLLQKYQGRALLLCTKACAMHCRYCFRRESPGLDGNTDFEQEIAQIAADPTLKEIILSGGDPLSLSNQKLAALLEQLKVIPHVKRIRFHTRFIMGIPERIDHEFVELLRHSGKQIIFVIHANHLAEFDREVWKALEALRQVGLVLHQAVLLRGVNDSIEDLTALFENLLEHSIIPYYLHQLDRVAGSSHFEVEEAYGIELIQELAKRLPGYGVPRYVREVPGQKSKMPIRG
jgi:EF-P beta-lysylation protein EpmB